MADDNQMNAFMDMFKDFGKNLNIPGPDVNDLVDHHRKNIQALQDAASAASAGGQEVMNMQRAQLEEALKDIAEMVQGAMSGGVDPSKMMADQAEFAKKSFETTVKNATEVGEVVKGSSEETFNILRARMEESISELSSGMKKDGGGL